jgi:Winged helix DNA-binding domain
VPDVLTQRDLNRALLARQLLIERHDLAAEHAIARVAGLQAQASVPPFVGLWTRLADFDEAELQQLIDDRRVVRATMMRHTIHFVGADDYLWLRPTIQPALDANFGAQTRTRLADVDIAPFLGAARKEFAKRPLTFADVKDLIRSLAPESDVDAIAYGVRTHLELIGVPNGSRWRFGGRAPFVLAEDWLRRPLAAPDPREMVRRYLAAFGPATPADATAWSGVGGMRQVFESMRGELRVFRDESGRELFDVPGAPLPSGDLEVPVRFLPEYDNTLLGHKDRTRVIADEHRPRVYLIAGRMLGTILVDGFAAASWRVSDGELAIDPFRKLTKAEQKAIEPEAEALLAWLRG